MDAQKKHSLELESWWGEKLQPVATNIKMETAVIMNLSCKEEYDGLLKLCGTTVARYIIEAGDQIFQDELSKTDNHLKAQFRYLVENCRNLIEESIGAETGFMHIQKPEELFKLSQTTTPETQTNIDQARSDFAQLKRPSLGEVSERSEISSDNGRFYGSDMFSSAVQPTFSTIQNNQIPMMLGVRAAADRFAEQSRMVYTEAADSAVNRSNRQPIKSSLTMNPTASSRRNPLDYLINKPKIAKPRLPD